MQKDKNNGWAREWTLQLVETTAAPSDDLVLLESIHGCCAEFALGMQKERDKSDDDHSGNSNLDMVTVIATETDTKRYGT